MSSSASSATWLSAALVRRAVVPPTHGGRHLAPETPGVVRIAAPQDLLRIGRHTEPEWSRALHDPRRDEIDAFAWLGFAQD
jgi:hypothetical protein